MRRLLLAVLATSVLSLAAKADDKKDQPDPKNLPVTAKLVAKQGAYALDLGGKSAEDFRKAVEEGAKAGKVPAPVAVDLVLELKNTSDKDVQVWISGDPTLLNLELKGQGAVSVTVRRAFTREFRLPKPVKIEAGKTFEMPIKQLSFGMRNMEKQAFWTEAGEHTLAATFRTAVSPAPEGSKNVRDGFGEVLLKTEPIKIKVEAK